MKRLDLVQLTIIIVGIFSAFFFIISLPQFLFYIYTWFSDGAKGGYYLDSLFVNIIISGSYLFAAWYCIIKSKHFAEWICHNAKLNAEINFALDKVALLFVLFVGLGIYGLIKNLPALLVDAFKLIKKSNSNTFLETPGPSTPGFIIEVFTVLLFFTLVYYAKVFADFFAGKINNTEPEDEIAATAELND